MYPIFIFMKFIFLLGLGLSSPVQTSYQTRISFISLSSTRPFSLHTENKYGVVQLNPNLKSDICLTACYRLLRWVPSNIPFLNLKAPGLVFGYDETFKHAIANTSYNIFFKPNKIEANFCFCHSRDVECELKPYSPTPGFYLRNAIPSEEACLERFSYLWTRLPQFDYGKRLFSRLETSQDLLRICISEKRANLKSVHPLSFESVASVFQSSLHTYTHVRKSLEIILDELQFQLDLERAVFGFRNSTLKAAYNATKSIMLSADFYLSKLHETIAEIKVDIKTYQASKFKDIKLVNCHRKKGD